MIGARIAALRRQANWSQAELADKLRCSPSAVGMYEQGRREPAADTLVRLAQVFGVSTDYLLTGVPSCHTEQRVLADVLLHSLAQGEKQAEARKERPFSRQELAVLMAAMLMEP